MKFHFSKTLSNIGRNLSRGPTLACLPFLFSCLLIIELLSLAPHQNYSSLHRADRSHGMAVGIPGLTAVSTNVSRMFSEHCVSKTKNGSNFFSQLHHEALQKSAVLLHTKYTQYFAHRLLVNTQ